MIPLAHPSKAKIARRVVEILEYFAEGNTGIVVADIVSAYNWPQSSTSELLGALTDMGLLHRDRNSRRFYPTPRLAALGVAGQPDYIANGRLFAFMDRLAQASRQSVVLLGMLGTNLQIFRVAPGVASNAIAMSCGAVCPLSSSAAGQLLLSTMGEKKASEYLWRLKAEAGAEQSFDLTEMSKKVANQGQLGHANGDAGFVHSAKVCAVLVPAESESYPLAVGVVYADQTKIDPEALLETLRFGVGQSIASDQDTAGASTRTLIAI